MVILLSIIHVLVCLILILIVLLQSGKGADLAGAFGGGGSQTAFGARGTATFLSKLDYRCSRRVHAHLLCALPVHDSQPGKFCDGRRQAGPEADSPSPVRIAGTCSSGSESSGISGATKAVTALISSLADVSSSYQIQRGSGGIGRHTILRGWRRKPCGFKSRLPHQFQPTVEHVHPPAIIQKL